MKFAVFAIVLALPFAGCLQDSDSSHETTGASASSIENAYRDADVRAYNSVAGEDTTTKTLSVPAGASRLTVKAWYSVAGTGDFVLKNPAGLTVREDHPEGAKSLHDDEWAVVDDPVPGAWKLTLTIEGSGKYSFGAYF